MTLARVGLPGDRSQHFKSLHLQRRCPPALQWDLCGTSGKEEEGWEAGRLGYPRKGVGRYSQEEPEMLVAGLQAHLSFLYRAGDHSGVPVSVRTIHSLKGSFQKFWQLEFVNDGNDPSMEHTYDCTIEERGEKLS